MKKCGQQCGEDEGEMTPLERCQAKERRRSTTKSASKEKTWMTMYQTPNEKEESCEDARMELNEVLSEAAEKRCKSGNCRPRMPLLSEMEKRKRMDYFAAHAPAMPDWYWIRFKARNETDGYFSDERLMDERLNAEVQWRWEFAVKMVAGELVRR